MRFSSLHWLGALIVSVLLHGLMTAAMTDREPAIEIERGAGDPVAIASNIAANVASVSSDNAGQTVEPVDEAVEEDQSVPLEVEPTPPQPTARDTVEPKTAVAPMEANEARPPTEQHLQPTGTAMRPSPVNAAILDAVSSETLMPQRSEKPAEQVIAELTPPTAQAEPMQPAEPSALREESVPDVVGPTELPPLPRAKPPKRVEEIKKQPKKSAKKKQRKKASAASSGTTGSATKGRKKRASGDGGRNQTTTGKAKLSNYLGRVVSRLQRQKRYPSAAKRKKQQGTAVIVFTISKNGGISGVRLKRGSGHSVLDKEVLAMVRRASPFPPIPANAGRRKISVSVPISFKVR